MKKYIIGLSLGLLLGGNCKLSATDWIHDSYDMENYMYVIPEEIVIDENENAQIDVYLNNTTEDFNTYLLDIYLPEGYEIAKGSRDNYQVIPNNGDSETSKTYDHSIAVGNHGDHYRILGTSVSGTPILPGEHILFTIFVQKTQSVNARSLLSASLRNIEIAAGTSGEEPHYFPDIDISIDASTAGIVDVVSGDKLNPNDIYNLQGVLLKRGASQEDVDALAPGLYIVGGKKVLVK